jgi:outer membrane lipoprotein SlyB
MASTERFAAPAQRWAGLALAAAFLAAAAWAQSDQPLDLHLPQPGAAGSSVCGVCGEIRSIREVHIGRAPGAQSGIPTGTNLGTDEWRVVGAVAYLPLDAAKNNEGWRFGAVGTPEMQGQFGESSYEITVLMDSGDHRFLQRRDGSRFQVGQRVRLREGNLETMFP